MRYLYFLYILVTSFSSFAYSVECGITANFKGIPQITKNTYQLTEQVSLFTKSYLNYQSKSNARMATNITCQLLSGSQYSGTQKEWQHLIDTNIKQLADSGFSSLTFTAVIGDAKKYTGSLINREYIIEAVKDKRKQIFYIVNILSRQKSTVYSVMVSADNSIVNEVEAEFVRVLSTLKIPKEQEQEQEQES